MKLINILKKRFLPTTLLIVAGAIGICVNSSEAQAALLKFTFQADFSGFTGQGSFTLDTSIQGTATSPSTANRYPKAIKDYQYRDIFGSKALPEADLGISTGNQPQLGRPLLTRFDFPLLFFPDPDSPGLNLSLEDQPSLAIQLSDNPSFYQLNSFWASNVKNSPFRVISLQVENISEPQQVPESTSVLGLLALGGLGAGSVIRKKQKGDTNN